MEGLPREASRIVPITAPSGEAGTLLLSISDASGDSAILKYLIGKLVIHHGRAYQLMTNSPTFDQQLALNTYWKGVGGTTFLAGTNRAPDRFVRASFTINEAKQSADPRTAVAAVFSVMRKVSVPIGIMIPSVLRASRKKLSFSEGSGARRPQLAGNPDVGGDQSANREPAEVFKFMIPHD